ncbi:MAG: FAD-dependent monooxygenase [Pseudomonadota bacterium]
MEPDKLFKWALFDREPMSTWGKGRVSLLGDACHPTLPFMAQGAAMSIEDAAVLAACLENFDDVTPALQHYEELRKERTAGIQLGSRRNSTMFHLPDDAAEARNHAMKSSPGGPNTQLFGYNALTVVSDSLS